MDYTVRESVCHKRLDLSPRTPSQSIELGQNLRTAVVHHKPATDAEDQWALTIGAEPV